VGVVHGPFDEVCPASDDSTASTPDSTRSRSAPTTIGTTGLSAAGIWSSTALPDAAWNT